MNSEKVLGFRALYFDLQGVGKSFSTSTKGPRPCAEPFQTQKCDYLENQGGTFEKLIRFELGAAPHVQNR